MGGGVIKNFWGIEIKMQLAMGLRKSNLSNTKI
jgi:hypothetical protein